MRGQRVGRKSRFVQHHYRSTGAGEGDRGRSTRAASPDNDYVDGLDRTRGHGLLRFQGWRISKFLLTHPSVLPPWVHGLLLSSDVYQPKVGRRWHWRGSGVGSDQPVRGCAQTVGAQGHQVQVLQLCGKGHQPMLLPPLT